MHGIDYNKRLASLEARMKKQGLDSFLVTSGTNVSYLSGFPGHDAIVLITRSKKFFLTDSRYIEEARNTLKGFDLVLLEGSAYSALSGIIKKNALKKIGFESMNMPYEVTVRLKGFIGSSKLILCKDVVEGLRSIKDAEEVNSIKRAVRLTKEVLKNTVSLVKPGRSEEFLSRKIEIEFIENGAKAGFDPIVASGANSSKPHAMPTGNRIRGNDLVMIDMGCSLDGYNSDITRMVFLGKIKEKVARIYNIVRTAQEKSIEKIAPGVKISDIDLAGRSYISGKGFGKYFGHSLGHGVGMEVHEQPTVSKSSEGVLAPGMVFTVEPAIYIPKLGGVRIEDMVLVTETGCEVLTR